MNTPEVRIYLDRLVEHHHQIYAGLYDLHARGRISLKLVPSSEGGVRGPTSNLWAVVRDPAEPRTIQICFDMSDGNRILSEDQLEACDHYFKRSYYESTYASIPPRLKTKIRPYGLNYYSTVGSGFGFKLSLAITPIRGRLVSSAVRRPAVFKELLRLLVALRPGRGAPLTFESLESHPDARAEPRILYQTRVWDPLEHPGDEDKVQALNDFRVRTVRVLRRHFGEVFVGGIEPHDFAKAHYADCLTPCSTERDRYVSVMKQCLIGVSTIGLHGSTPFKIAEYLATSRCIVGEPLNYALPVPLEEDRNYITFRSPEESVEACQRILDDADLAEEMRKENWAYYQQHVRPGALLSRCLDTALRN